jgi:adenosine deaminase
MNCWLRTAATALVCLLPLVGYTQPPASTASEDSATPQRAYGHPATHSAHVVHAPAMTSSERAAQQAFDAAKGDPLALHALLVNMPKGADLHMHLSGAVYAETFLADAAVDGLCVDPVRLAFVRPTAPARASVSSTSTPVPAANPACATGMLPEADAFKDQHLYDELIDSFSMRTFVPSEGISGHDQFFATFARFAGISKSHMGEWLDEVATRAADQNEQYLEIMQTPSTAIGDAIRRTAALGWPQTSVREGDCAASVASVPLPMSACQTTPWPTRSSFSAATQQIDGTTPAELAAYRDKLLAGGLRDDLVGYKAEFANALAQRNAIEHCGQPDAEAGCSVEIRFLFQVLRAFPPQVVFEEALTAFELAQSDPDQVVGLNFVQPEDDYLAMAEYTRQMRMLDYLHTVYPRVHITLHAGELAPGLVPPAGLHYHIRQAVDLGHAERIGHGVDVMYERDPAALLREMAERHIMVEINLTSNDVILGISANHHALPAYLRAHVPVALSTDDEGVSRIDLTHEYVRAVLDQHLTYLDLKQMARTSLEHSFLPGVSLWATPDDFTRMRAPCGTAEHLKAHQAAAGQSSPQQPGPECIQFLRDNRKAAEQWELEHRYRVFESSLPTPASAPRHR